MTVAEHKACVNHLWIRVGQSNLWSCRCGKVKYAPVERNTTDKGNIPTVRKGYGRMPEICVIPVECK